MASHGARGVSRVLEKLESSVKNGDYYEAHQMYKTVYFRYLAQKKYDELLDMLYNGAVLFLDRDQQLSGTDLALLLVEVLVKSQSTQYVQWAPKLSKIFSKINPTLPERNAFMANAIRWSTSNCSKHGHYALHQGLAQVYWNEKDYVQARHHYIYSNDGMGCAQLLIEYQILHGFRKEVDLFITQAVLQYLCLSNKATASQTFNKYTREHPRIKKSGPPYLFPLLNFIWFLLQAVESPKLSTFTVLCEKYEQSIKRDPCYVEYLDKIGQLFFGLKPPPAMPSHGLFGNLFESFFQGLDDSDEENILEQASTSSIRSLGLDLELD